MVSAKSALLRRTRQAPRLTITASSHLDLARAGAAIAVMIGHLRALFFVPFGQVRQPNSLVRVVYFATSLGHQAVMLFFVLSGFLISSSVLRTFAADHWSWSWYLSRRLTRLLVVLLPALVATLVLDRFGAHLFGHAGVYGPAPRQSAVLSFSIPRRDGISTLLGNVFFLQGIRVSPFGSNAALWSLANEFWYYLMFPLLVLAAWLRRNGFVPVLAIAAILVFVGIDIGASFLIWLFGTVAFLLPPLRWPIDQKWQRVAVATMCPAFLLGILLVVRSRLAGLEGDLLLGAGFAVVVYFIVHGSEEASGPPPLGRAIERLAGFSYTLYLVHLPLLVLVRAWTERAGQGQWQPDIAHIALGVLLAIGVLAYAFAFARLTEKQTDRVRRRLTATLTARTGGAAG